MTATSALLRSLEAITNETVRMLVTLDDTLDLEHRSEAKRRVLELKDNAQSLFDLLATGTLPDDYLDLVFSGPPDAEATRFLEVESPRGESVTAGEWLERADGDWALRLQMTAARRSC